MAVVVSRVQIDRVKASLAGVTSNGQALAALEAAQRMAADLRRQLEAKGGAIRDGAARDLAEYSRRLDPFVAAFRGNADATAAAGWNAPKGAREQTFNLWMLGYTMQSTLAANQLLDDSLGAAFAKAVADLPQTLGDAAKVAAKVVNKVALEASKVGGSIALGVASGAWPLLLIAGVVAVGWFAFKGRLGKLVSL